jgi:3D (Asp-Asp-Asp) domain-containing protein
MPPDLTITNQCDKKYRVRALDCARGVKRWEMVATAYIATCLGCTGITASGKVADYRQHYVAASRQWPMGTCLELELSPGKWTRYTVQDRGPRRENQVDILVSTEREAIEWGVKTIKVKRCGGVASEP